MNIGIRLVRPISRRLVRTVRMGRKFLVLTTLSTISFAACQDGPDTIGSEGAEADRAVVFRHFV